MSLFEKLKNKRYDLQEAPIDDKGNITPEPGEVEKSKKIVKKYVSKHKRIERKNIKSNTQQGDKLLQDINKRKSADLTRADAINRSMGTSGSTEGAAGAGGTATKTKPKTKTKTIDQAEVSKKAKKFTKEINKKRTGGFEDITGEGKVKYPKNRTHLIAKRKEYGIDRKGNISKSGVEKYARNMKRSNLPLTKKELSTAKQFAVGGKTILGKGTKGVKDKIIGTTTGKYGGKLGRRRNKNMKTYDQIKKDIDLKDLQKASDAKARKIARSKELKDLTKKMGEKELYQKVTQQAKLKQMRPQRKIYKRLVNIGQSTTKAFGGPKAKLPPVAKKFAKVVAAAPAPVKVASVAALPLLSPTVRKTVKNVALAGLGAAGFAVAKKKPPKPESFDIGINLSSGKGSSEPSKYALKRQELLKTNPKKVPNKNIA